MIFRVDKALILADSPRLKEKLFTEVLNSIVKKSVIYSMRVFLGSFSFLFIGMLCTHEVSPTDRVQIVDQFQACPCLDAPGAHSVGLAALHSQLDGSSETKSSDYINRLERIGFYSPAEAQNKKKELEIIHKNSRDLISL